MIAQLEAAIDWKREFKLWQLDRWTGWLEPGEGQVAAHIGMARYEESRRNGRKPVYTPASGDLRISDHVGAIGEVFVGLIRGEPPLNLVWGQGEKRYPTDFRGMEVKSHQEPCSELWVTEYQLRGYPAKTVIVLVGVKELRCRLVGSCLAGDVRTRGALREGDNRRMWVVKDLDPIEFKRPREGLIFQ